MMRCDGPKFLLGVCLFLLLSTVPAYAQTCTPDWGTAGVSADGQVLSVTTFDDGMGGGSMVYAVGDFTNAGGVAATRAARWDGSTWLGDVGGFNLIAFVVRVADARIYVGGDFTTWNATGMMTTPARRNAVADSAMVLPVVTTSSISQTRSGSRRFRRARIAPRTFRRR